MQITSGRKPTAMKVVLYGAEGIGKSTFASKFPNPLFIDTEGSTSQMDVTRFNAPQNWSDVLGMVDYVLQHTDICKTLVIDTADWCERLCIDHICNKNGKKGIEDFGYGKGYVYLAEEFQNLIEKCDRIISFGINVVFTAHAMMRKFEQPDEMGAYDRWELKLGKKTAPLLKEWADMLLFANYKTIVVTDGNSKKAQGGKRVMYASHHPCWDAKNRSELPDEMPFDFDAISSVILGAENYIELIDTTETAQISNKEVIKSKIDEYTEESENKLTSGNAKERAKARKKEMYKADGESPYTPDDQLPFDLVEKMKASGITAEQIEKLAAERNKVPSGTKLSDFPKAIIDGWVLRYWAQVVKAIK